jgi:pantothenate kinase type III
MSKKINHFIKELIAEDTKDIKKLTKKELFNLTIQLLENNYRELHSDTIVELYENVFHTYVRNRE